MECGCHYWGQLQKRCDVKSCSRRELSVEHVQKPWNSGPGWPRLKHDANIRECPSMLEDHIYLYTEPVSQSDNEHRFSPPQERNPFTESNLQNGSDLSNEQLFWSSPESTRSSSPRRIACLFCSHKHRPIQSTSLSLGLNMFVSRVSKVSQHGRHCAFTKNLSQLIKTRKEKEICEITDCILRKGHTAKCVIKSQCECKECCRRYDMESMCQRSIKRKNSGTSLNGEIHKHSEIPFPWRHPELYPRNWVLAPVEDLYELAEQELWDQSDGLLLQIISELHALLIHVRSTICTRTVDCVRDGKHIVECKLFPSCKYEDCDLVRDHNGPHKLPTDLRSTFERLQKAMKKRCLRETDSIAQSVTRTMNRSIAEGSPVQLIPPICNRNKLSDASDPLRVDPIRYAKNAKSELNHRERQIRLFHLQPDLSSGSIKGHFGIVNLQSAPDYTALSYTWGWDNTTNMIDIEHGDPMAVKNDLWQFLKVYSQKITEPMTFWIDALCINQEDVHERNHQVGLMRQIYTHAGEVIVWLGSAADDSDLVMKYLRAQASKTLQVKSQGYNAIWSKRVGKAMSAFCERSYWRRMWIIQEILHASRLTVWCGETCCDWVSLESMYLKLMTIRDTGWFAHHPYASQVIQSTASTIIWQRAHFRTPDTPRVPLRLLIEIFRDWKCTDVRDKIFALVGLAAMENNVTPDYTLTSRQLYVAVQDALGGRDEAFSNLLSQLLGLTHKDVRSHERVL